MSVTLALYLPAKERNENILNGVRVRLAMSSFTPTIVFIMKKATPGIMNSVMLQANTTTVQKAEYTASNWNKRKDGTLLV